MDGFRVRIIGLDGRSERPGPPLGRTLRQRIYEITQDSPRSDRVGFAFDVFIMSLIALNVIAVMLSTVEWLEARYGAALYAFEIVSVVVFTVEYLVRVWVCVEDPKYARPIMGRIKYVLSPMALIDAIAIVPFYLPLVFAMDLRVARLMRLFRFFRVFKLARYSESMRTLGRVFASRREELTLVLIAELFLLVFIATLMYFIEHDAQPEAFSSIPASMWWAVVTLTTVGYGDVSPVTPAGQACAGALALVSIAAFALPAGILASAFDQNVRTSRHGRARCHYCGRLGDETVGNANTMPAPPRED